MALPPSAPSTSTTALSSTRRAEANGPLAVPGDPAGYTTSGEPAWLGDSMKLDWAGWPEVGSGSWLPSLALKLSVIETGAPCGMVGGPWGNTFRRAVWPGAIPTMPNCGRQFGPL